LSKQAARGDKGKKGANLCKYYSFFTISQTLAHEIKMIKNDRTAPNENDSIQFDQYKRYSSVRHAPTLPQQRRPAQRNLQVVQTFAGKAFISLAEKHRGSMTM
jgi:hypothetical protein